MVVGLIGLMILTGFDIHGSLPLLGLKMAVSIHNILITGLLILCFIMIVSVITVNKQIQNLSATSDEFDMDIIYRATGIFGAFQFPFLRHLYFSIGLTLFSVQLITGALYIGYNYWSVLIFGLPLRVIAYIHTGGAYIITAFMIIHVYLTFILPKFIRSERRSTLH